MTASVWARRGRRVALARADVEPASLHVDRRRVPHGRARRVAADRTGRIAFAGRRRFRRECEYERQTSLPVFASSAVTPPRNVQHSYAGSAAAAHSFDDSGTYSRPSNNRGEPVIVRRGCASTRVFHCSRPVCASTAYALPLKSPKYSRGRAFVSPARPRFERWARAHFRVREERPAHAAGVEVERVHRAVLAAHEHGAGADGRLRTCARGARERERPLEFELRHVRRLQARGASRRRTVTRRAPCSSPRAAAVARSRTRSALPHSASRPRPATRSQRRAAEELGESAALLGGQRRTLRAHHAGLERIEDRLRVRTSGTSPSAAPAARRPRGRSSSTSCRARRGRGPSLAAAELADAARKERPRSYAGTDCFSIGSLILN